MSLCLLKEMPMCCCFEDKRFLTTWHFSNALASRLFQYQSFNPEAPFRQVNPLMLRLGEIRVFFFPAPN